MNVKEWYRIVKDSLKGKIRVHATYWYDGLVQFEVSYFNDRNEEIYTGVSYKDNLEKYYSVLKELQGLGHEVEVLNYAI